jgi:hypothetical protein
VQEFLVTWSIMFEIGCERDQLTALQMESAVLHQIQVQLRSNNLVDPSTLDVC